MASGITRLIFDLCVAAASAAPISPGVTRDRLVCMHVLVTWVHWSLVNPELPQAVRLYGVLVEIVARAYVCARSLSRRSTNIYNG